MYVYDHEDLHDHHCQECGEGWYSPPMDMCYACAAALCQRYGCVYGSTGLCLACGEEEPIPQPSEAPAQEAA